MSALIEKVKDFMVGFEKGQLIGVDIGLSAVKVALLSKNKNSYKLEKYLSVALSEAAIIEDEVQKSDEVVEAITEAIQTLGISKKIACLGMNGPNTVTKRLQVPDGVAEEVEDNILWESEQYIPFGADDAEINFSILGKFEDEDIIDAIVGAVKTSVAEKYIAYLTDAGLTVKVVDLNVFSIINVFELSQEENIETISSEGTIIVDLGAQYTTIIVYKNGGPVLTKEIAIGGVLITEEIQRSMGVSYLEAEDLKINGDDEGNLPEEIVPIIESHYLKLTEELKKVLNFYISVGSSEQVGSCFITGGSSNLPGAKEALSELMNLEVYELNPFEVIEVKADISDEELAAAATCGVVALGLGMRSV